MILTTAGLGPRPRVGDEDFFAVSEFIKKLNGD